MIISEKMSSVSDFLKDLPSRNKENFTRLNPDSHHRGTTGKKSTYLTTKDDPPEQIIVTERTNILLRFLHQQWDKKTNSTKKRVGEEIQDEVPEKRAKIEPGASEPTTPGPSRTRTDSSRSAGSLRGSSQSSLPAGPPPPYDITRLTRLL
ncbi:DET1- and DDB1-associated protein 1-like [Eurytemora carolleeae]|uniref:DET1- and DDB1-associated protein 1-like n=1 Tax=Eurytemora carolleeae TaxID=1294199 RepID=UPI000C7569E0|nr:DET1- and DDB1-associated protein 1-like [Eurytemora carolleeae]|eukprot:XP_023322897.1 DET1- and DDB1-associated protein 1-like [Eurytemora affinis]